MYESFFQLTKPPFSLVSDPGCIHVTPTIKNVLQNLVHGVFDRRGCLTLTAEPGLGKTTVLRALCDFLTESNANSSTVFIPTITSSDFLELLMINFGIQDIPASKARRIKTLEEFLIRSDDEDRISALIVDEVHTVSDEVLEEIRLLSNFEVGNRKLLQIVLAGQPEFADRLNRPGLWQFKQRIATRLSLSRLDSDSVAAYIHFRWSEAATSPFPFTDPAVAAINDASRGVPRMINVVCHNALRIAFSEMAPIVDARIISEACRGLDLPVPSRPQAVVLPTGRPLGADRSAAAEAALEVQLPRPAAALPQEPKSRWTRLWRRDAPPSGRRPNTSILSLGESTE